MRVNFQNIQSEPAGPPTVADPSTPMQPAAEVWEPPFDRWMRMADDMLRGWPRPVATRPVAPRPIKSVRENRY